MAIGGRALMLAIDVAFRRTEREDKAERDQGRLPFS